MHKLQAVIKKELEKIPEGFKGVILRGHTVININNELPPEFDYLRISAHVEYGEASRKNRGMACILSNINGNPFEKFSIKTEGEGRNSTVWADITGKFISVNVLRKGDNIIATLRECEVISPEDFAPECGDFRKKIIWSFNDSKEKAILPGYLIKYQNLLDAAIEKSECLKCRCLHFYDKEIQI